MTTEFDPPSARSVVAGAMAAALAPIRDVDILALETRRLTAHTTAAAAAATRFEADVAAMEDALGRPLRLAALALSLPPDLGRMIRFAADGRGVDAVALALDVLHTVFVPDANGNDLVGAVLGQEAR